MVALTYAGPESLIVETGGYVKDGDTIEVEDDVGARLLASQGFTAPVGWQPPAPTEPAAASEPAGAGVEEPVQEVQEIHDGGGSFLP